MQDNDKDFIGWKRANARELPCRTCKNAFPGGIAKATCEVFNDIYTNAKPENVYFENEPCPKYEQGEDLISKELILPEE
jgi:hypothetical protein